MAVRAIGRSLRGVGMALALLSLAAAPSPAAGQGDGEDITASPPNESWHRKTVVAPEPSQETWVGAETFAEVWTLYTGATWSPFGSLRQDGWRLRTVGGGSQYRYAGLRYSIQQDAAVPVAFRGQGRFLDLLAGYQWSSGPLTVKVFAGVEVVEHVIAPYDVETLVQGKAKGAKGALEAWWNLGHRGWLALDVSAAQAYHAYSARLRGAARLGDWFSVGVEAQAIGHIETDLARKGAFFRFDDGRNEASIAVGRQTPRSGPSSTYGTVQWLVRY
jgi:hypothetical protein